MKIFMTILAKYLALSYNERLRESEEITTEMGFKMYLFC